MNTIRSSVDVSFDDIESAAYEAYSGILTDLKAKGLYPLRFWNFVPNINEGANEQGDGENERYKLFNRGRRKAWLEYDPTLNSVCAASCVGSFGQDVLKISYLATENPVVHINNPQQISFLDYSAKYGAPPSSRRGTLHMTPTGIEVWIAGTASIVGEDNKFTEDVVKQTKQTLENIQALITDDNLRQYYSEWESRSLSLKDLRNIRVYLRHLGDEEKITGILEGSGMSAKEIEFVHADICRRPLDVEIEGMIPTES